VGGFAERMKFSAVLLFSAIWLIVVYAPITHWVWGGLSGMSPLNEPTKTPESINLDKLPKYALPSAKAIE
jgi:hypothetical protein